MTEKVEGMKTMFALQKFLARELDMDIIIPDNRFSDLSVMKVLEKNIEVIADLITFTQQLWCLQILGK